jgi:hypothetical protein
MLVEKWIIVESLAAIQPEIERMKMAELYICWFPNSCEELFDNENLLRINNSSYSQKIVVGVNLSLADSFFSCQKDDIYEQFLRLFFQINYYKRNGCPVVVAEHNEKGIGLFIEKLTRESIAHGYKGLEIRHLKKTLLCRSNELLFDNKPEDIVIVRLTNVLKDWITSVLQKNEVERLFVFIKTTNKHSFLSILLKLEETEKLILQHNQFFDLIPLLIKVDSENEILRLNLESSVREKKSLSEYLNFQKEISRELLKWYGNEYEVLPSWFKRTGHIIKVAMGKRSFRSLFDDNVKKYKD